MTNLKNSTWLKVAIIYALGVMAAMTVSESVTELGHIAREFHPHSHAAIGWVLSMPALMVAIGALFVGYVVDKVGDRPILFLGAVVIIIGDIFAMLVQDLHWLLVARGVTGIGYVMTAVSAIALLIHITSGKQRTLALAIWSTFVPVSFILPFLTADLANSFGTWRAAFSGHILATAFFLLAGLLFVLPRADGEAEQMSRTRGLSAVLRSPLVYLLGISFIGNAFLQAGTISTLTPYLAHQYGVAPSAVNAWNSVAMVFNMVGALSVGVLLNRGVWAWLIGVVGVIIAGVSGYAIFGFPIGFQASIGMSWLMMLGLGFLVGMWALVPIVAPAPNAMGATGGLVTQLTLIGVLVSTPTFFAAQAMGSRGPMMIVLAVALLVCLSAFPVWLKASGKSDGAAAHDEKSPNTASAGAPQPH